MTAPHPTLMEQATIDRLGVFDDEKFAEITGAGPLPEAPREVPL